MSTKKIIYKDTANKFYEYIVNKTPCKLDLKQIIYLINIMIDLRDSNKWTNKGLDDLLSGKYADDKSKKYWDAIIDVISIYDKSVAFIETYSKGDTYIEDRIKYKSDGLREYANECPHDIYDEKQTKNLCDVFRIIRDYCPEYYSKNKKLIDGYLKNKKITKDIIDIIIYIYENDYLCLLTNIQITSKTEPHFGKEYNSNDFKEYTDATVVNFLVYEKILKKIDETIVKGGIGKKPCIEYQEYKNYLSKLPFTKDKGIVEDALYIIDQYEWNPYLIYLCILNSATYLPDYKDCEFISKKAILN